MPQKQVNLKNFAANTNDHSFAMIVPNDFK